MENPLSKLALDYWYQVLMVVGALVFRLAAAGLLKELPVLPTVLIAAGAFFIGLGEWINHPLQTAIMEATFSRPAGIITGHPRKASLIGMLFLLLGLALVGYGIYKSSR